jgi:hydrogenase maturation protease
MKTVILGLGNPILHDDGAGVAVAERLQGMIAHPDVEIRTASVGGLRILDQIAGFDRAIIVDALLTGREPAGSVKKMNVAELSGDLHASCIHDLSLAEALNLGQIMGMAIPAEITIYGIEVGDPYTLYEGCSNEVMKGVEEVVRLVREDLTDFIIV